MKLDLLSGNPRSSQPEQTEDSMESLVSVHSALAEHVAHVFFVSGFELELELLKNEFHKQVKNARRLRHFGLL